MATETATDTTTRSQLTKIIGIVSSAKTAKTLKVEVKYQTKHPKYGKYLKRTSVYHVHDENGDAHEGDTVEIAECRPFSRTKHHRLTKVITKAPEKLTHDTGDAITGASGAKKPEADVAE
jgi:small subunit ribosomal protein S17